MCGFVALFLPGRAPVDAPLLDRMTDALGHRGPDGRGVFHAPGCGLGHRRLAIIDLEGGAQPLAGADPRVVIAFNGEAFDYRTVRARLPGPWRTQSDTEVFLRAYEVRGLAGIAELSGMWGAAIWDGRTEELVVVRDRLGKKPVYYAELAGGGFAFASELRALLLHPGVRRELDPTALDQLLTYRFVPGPRTLLKSIRKLRPGHAAIASARGLRIERYWDPRPTPRAWRDAEAEEAFAAAFDRAVRLRMVSDVPVGLFLSGGLDSAAVLQAMGTRGVHAFTVAFEGGEADDEIPHARETAALFGAQHHAVVVGPRDYADYLDRYAAQLEEPVLNDSAIAVHFLSKLAREHVKVVLSGQGADEPLAGYDRYRGEFLSRAYRALPGRGLIAPHLERALGREPLRRALRSLGERDDVARALAIYSVFTPPEKRALLGERATARRLEEDTAAPVARLYAEAPHLSPLGRMLYADTRLGLVDDLLLVADKLSMAHGLEVRTPFLDHRLIELVESMPDAQKLRLGRRGLETKRVHRAAMARRLPAPVLRRKKRGFTNPLDAWLRAGLRPLVEERLLSPGARIHEVLSPRAVTALHAEHQSGHRDRRRQLFLLLTLEAWLRSTAGIPRLEA